MSEQESSIRLTAKADIADAVSYARAIDETTAAIRRHIEAVKDAAAAGVQVGGAPGSAGATGGAATGSAPPTPPPPAQGAGGAVVPAAPTGGSVAARGAGGPPVTGGAATGQPPAAPGVVGASGAAAASPTFNFPASGNQGSVPQATANQARAMAAVAGHAPAAVAAGIPGFGSYSFDPSGPAARQFRERLMDHYGGPDKAPPSMGARAAQGGMSFLQHATSTAIGVGLGTSLSGFLLAAPQRYLALSESITTVGRKFREADENATRFGGSLGYTIARTAQLADTLGRETNTVNRGQFQRNAGFARFTGMDPGAAMRGFGSIERLSGGPMTDPQMAQLLATAKSRGMDQGRLEEFVEDLTDSIRGQFQTTGRATMQQALATQGLQSIVYGPDDPRRSGDKTFLSGLQATMTGSDVMKTYLMRAMGYGKAGGPGYIDAKVRTEAGLHDSRNVIDLFESFQQRGMGRGAQFRALESVAGGNLSAHQLNALVSSLGTKEGLDRYRELAGKDSGGSMKAFMAMLDPASKEAFEQAGFGKLGEKHISAGEAIDVRIERMMMTVGKPIAEAIPPLQNAIESIAGAMQNLTGVEWGTLIPSMARGIEKIAKLADQMSSGKGFDEVRVGGMKVMDSSEDISGRIGKLRYLNQNYGVGWIEGYNVLRTKGEAGLDALIYSRTEADRQATEREMMGPAGGGQ
jgi:hypothetical protein